MQTPIPAPTAQTMPPIRNFPSSDTVSAGSVFQHKKLRFARSLIHNATIVRVLHGQKTLRHADGEWILPAGSLTALADNQSFDILNEADPEQGYFSQWLTISDGWIEQFHRQYSETRSIPTVQAIPPNTAVNEAFDRVWRSIRERHDTAVLQARTWELLAWLRQSGIVFGPPPNTAQHLVKRVRQIIAQDTAKNLHPSEVAALLHMSESTLRRRLAREQTSFRQLACGIKMMRALTLLQSTQQPVALIADSVGYESPARFSARFRQHFGCTPGEVRAAQRKKAA